jgi:hypothetical protein
MTNKKQLNTMATGAVMMADKNNIGHGGILSYTYVFGQQTAGSNSAVLQRV